LTPRAKFKILLNDSGGSSGGCPEDEKENPGGANGDPTANPDGEEDCGQQ